MQENASSVLKLEIADTSGLAVRRAIEIEIESHGIAIRPAGYGHKLSIDGQGSPVFIEFRSGIPTVVIWDDINNEEPSQVISLKSAAESNRVGTA